MAIRMNEPKIIRKLAESSKITAFDIYPKLKGQKRDIACPFSYFLGTVNNTEFGETAGNIKIGDFTTYSRIFTGKDIQLVIWDNSTFCEKVNDDDDFLTKKFKVGDQFEAYRISKSTINSLSPTNEVIDAVQETTNTTITFLFVKRRLPKDYLYKAYVIPTQFTNELFFISTIIEVIDPDNPDDVLWSEITFNSLNDKLSRVGQQISQYIQFGAPGEGYAFPEYTSDEEGKENEIVLSPERLKNQGVTEIQLETFGPSIITALYAFGRKVNQTDNKMNAPGHLLPYQVNTPTGSDLNVKTSGENNYYFIDKAEVVVDENYSDWQTKVSSQYDDFAKRNYEGFIRTNKDAVVATNTTNPQTEKINDFWSPNWLIPMREEAKNQDTSAVSYTNNTLTLQTDKTPSYYLMMNAFIFQDTEKLPFTIEESTTWAAKNIPVVGGFVNLVLFGVPLGWKNTDAIIQGKPISGFIPKTLYDVLGNQVEVANEGDLTMDAFRNGTPDSVGAIIGTNTMGSILNISLTDKIVKDGITKQTYLIGQDEDKGGFLINGEEEISNPFLENDEGFAIDIINFKVVGKCDVKLTAYRYGIPVFQAILQTRAKFTGSIREWSNTYRLNVWNEINNKTIPFPENIPEKPPAGQYQDIYVTLNYLFLSSGNVEKFNYEELTTIDVEEILLIDLGKYNLTWETAKDVYGTMQFNLNDLKFEVEEIYYYKEENDIVIVDFSLFEIENDDVQIKQINKSGQGNTYLSYCTDERCTPSKLGHQTLQRWWRFNANLRAYRVGDKIYAKIVGTRDLPDDVTLQEFRAWYENFRSDKIRINQVVLYKKP